MRLALQQRLPREVIERKRQFRKALALAELTAAQWADKHGIGATYLSRFLAGQTVSAPLTAKVDAFIAKYLGKRLGNVA